MAASAAKALAVSPLSPLTSALGPRESGMFQEKGKLSSSHDLRQAELKDLTVEPLEGVTVDLGEDDNLFLWNVSRLARQRPCTRCLGSLLVGCVRTKTSMPRSVPGWRQEAVGNDPGGADAQFPSVEPSRGTRTSFSTRE